MHVRLAIDPKKSDQQVRGVAELPHGTGKKMKIAVFTTTQKKEAEEAGADIAGGEELIEKIKSSGKIDADIAIATPEMMPRLGDDRQNSRAQRSHAESKEQNCHSESQRNY